MDYINEMFARTDLQHIREFLMNGVESGKIRDKSYKDRLDKAFKVSTKIVESEISDEEKQQKIISGIISYQGESENVYMEVGMKCGAMLVMQLLSELA